MQLTAVNYYCLLILGSLGNVTIHCDVAKDRINQWYKINI